MEKHFVWGISDILVHSNFSSRQTSSVLFHYYYYSSDQCEWQKYYRVIYLYCSDHRPRSLVMNFKRAARSIVRWLCWVEQTASVGKSIANISLTSENSQDTKSQTCFHTLFQRRRWRKAEEWAHYDPNTSLWWKPRIQSGCFPKIVTMKVRNRQPMTNGSGTLTQPYRRALLRQNTSSVIGTLNMSIKTWGMVSLWDCWAKRDY